jgi:putative Mg2+ transporter-C (MgtC) family protein
VIGQVASRLVVAVALGFVVGIEREASGQPAGLRTHASVAIGACLFGIISTLGFLEYQAVRETTNVQVDVTRVASNVVVGVGFLGAGLIFRQGGHVRNLTTAASLWAVAAIGLAAGVGNPGAAALTTLALVATLVLLRPVRALIDRRLVRRRLDVTIVLVAGADPAPVLETVRAVGGGVEVRNLSVGKEEGRAVLHASFIARRGVGLDTSVLPVADRADVWSVRSDESG